MKIEMFTRRPFDVEAVQVTPSNAAEIAEWCGGQVIMSTYRLAGFDTDLPCVNVPGNGPKKGMMIEAKISAYVVRLEGKFRVFRKAQFHEMFCKTDQFVREELNFNPDDLVEVIDPKDPMFGWQGQVDMINQTCVIIPGSGGYLCEPQQLKKIEEYSDETKQLISQEVSKDLDRVDNVLDKINALRAEAEKVVMSGSLHETITEAFEETQFQQDDLVKVNDGGNGETGLVTVVGVDMPGVFGRFGIEVLFGQDTYEHYFPEQLVRVGRKTPEEIKGMRATSVVRVREELNVFFSQCGVVEEIVDDNTLSVRMETPGNPVVKHLARELELEELSKWVCVNNPLSAQNGWVGWVVQDAPVGELVRVAFRPANYQAPANDKCFSYMGYELEEMTHEELGAIPTYEI